MNSGYHYVQSEQIVLGRMMHFSGCREEALSKLKASDFTGSRCEIFSFLKKETERNVSFKSGDVEVFIGIEHGIEMVKEATTCHTIAAEQISFPRHVENVLAASMIRKARAELSRAHSLLDESEQPNTTGEAQALVTSVFEPVALVMAGSSILDLKSQTEVIREFEKEFERRKGGLTVDGLVTGLEAFDEKTGGLHAGETYVLAARPGVGKTATMLAMIMGICSREKSVLVESLEMSFQRLFEREYASASGISLSRIRNPSTITQADSARLSRGYSELIKAKIHYGSSSTVSQIRSDCTLLKSRNLIDVLFVDYLGLIEPSQQSGSRERQVADISRGLKLIAVNLQIPVVALSQLNRNVDESQEPSLTDLRDSGAIEQDASVVLMLWGDQNSQQPNWKIAKNRNGELARGVFDFQRVNQRINNFKIAQTTSTEPREKKYGSS